MWGEHKKTAISIGNNTFVINRVLPENDYQYACECVNALAGIENPAEFVTKAKQDAEAIERLVEALRVHVKQLESDKARVLEALSKIVMSDGFDQTEIVKLITEMEA